jgi:exopolyphosphatase/guanosine-5'-triphosphate,3'-diphosphate pyrophosphatase
LIAVRDASGVLRDDYHETRGTRLGEGVNETGRLQPEAMARTLAAVADYAKLCAGAARTWGIGTSALRDASNADEFVASFSQAAGVPLAILTGEEEASSSFEGAMCGLKAAARIVPASVTVVDVGGGSTEFATRVRERDEPRVASLQIGAVRLTERFFTSDPPRIEEVERCRQAIRAALAGLLPDVRPAGSVVAVGGTASTAGRMLQLTDPGAGATVADIPAADLAALLKATLALPLRERVRLRGLPAQRADIFPAGLMILDETVRTAESASLIVSESDLLLGYLTRHA